MGRGNSTSSASFRLRRHSGSLLFGPRSNGKRPDPEAIRQAAAQEEVKIMINGKICAVANVPAAFDVAQLSAFLRQDRQVQLLRAGRSIERMMCVHRPHGWLASLTVSE